MLKFPNRIRARAASLVALPAVALLGYKMSDSTTLAIGYRHLDVDYDKGDFAYDARFSGPFVGLSFRF